MGQRMKLGMATVVVVGLAVAGLVIYRGGGERGGRGAGVADTPSPPTAEGPRGTAAPALTDQPTALATLAGSVRDAITGGLVEGADVRFRGPVEVIATSDEQGRFDVELPGGSYEVSVASEELVSLRAVILSVAAGARLTDFAIAVVATAQVNGRVVDGDGNPLGAAELSCSAELAGEPVGPGGSLAPCVAASSEDGAFSIAVPPGRVELRAAMDGRPPASALLRWVEPGAHLSGVELVLDHPARVTGTVVDGAGGAVSVGLVTAWRGDRVLASAAIDAGGVFALAPLPAGTVHLRATAPGHGEAAARAVELVAGGEQAVTLVMSAPQRLRGTVVDGDANPVAGARVEVRYPGTDAVVASAASDAAGAFEIDAVGRGPYDVIATKAGFAAARRGQLGAPVDDLTLTLLAGGGVAGTVTANGAPLTEFSVRLTSFVPIGGGAGAARLASLRFAAPDGSYRIDGVEPGRYDLVVAAPGFAPTTLAGVNVPPGSYAAGSAELVGGATVAGTVVSGQTHRPLFGVVVSLSSGYEGEVAYTDADGRYQISDVAPGRRSINYRHPGFVGRIESGIELAIGDRRVVDMELQPRDSSAVDDGVAGEPIEFAGIGAAITWRRDRLWVQGVVPRSPAEVAGLEPGDEIVEIDGVETRGRGLGASIEQIRGVAGTSVRLRLVRGEAEPFVLDIVRATVRYEGPGGE